MFDVMHHHKYSETKHVNVTETRSPTDESVRMLMDLEKAAKDKIIASMSLENNVIHAVIHHESMYIDCTNLFRIIYQINGEKRTLDARLPVSKIEDAMEQIYKTLAEDIAGYLISNTMTPPYKNAFK